VSSVYQIADRKDSRALSQYLAQNGQLLLPMVELISSAQVAVSFLQRDLEPDVAAAAGLRGCVAADRIVSLGPDGSIFPCSQLVGRSFRAGNLLIEEQEELWRHSPVLARYRGFRERLQGSCAACPAVPHCGGCRVYAADAIGADQSCPHIEASGDTRTPYPQWIARTSRRLADEPHTRGQQP